MKLLISTLYRGDANPIALYKLGADKVIFLVDNPTCSARQKGLEKIKSQFKNLFKIDTVHTSEFDVYKIVQDILSKVRKEKYDELVFHATEARKTMFLGCLYAASLLRKRCFYLRQDNNELYEIPLFKFKFNKTQIDLLKVLGEGLTNKSKIAKKIKKSRSIIYENLKSLKQDGFIDENDKLTDVGRICLLGLK